jgi:hypothetical protein
MLFGNERVIRQAYTDGESITDSVIVKEIMSSDGRVYCRTHIDFEDSNNIHESFEKICAKYGISLDYCCIITYDKGTSDITTRYYAPDMKELRRTATEQLGYKMASGAKHISIFVQELKEDKC